MAQQQNGQEQDLNHLLKVRREKLKELQDSGRDPFKITKYDVTAHTADIKDNYEEWEAGRSPSPDVSCPSASWARLPSATSRT